MAETPVSTGSAGGSRRVGLSGLAVDRGRRRARATGGPPSTGSPRPLQTRPSQPGPTGMRSGSPANDDPGAAPSRCRSVPSSTWTTARSRSTSRTRPCRTSPRVACRIARRTRPSRRRSTPRTTSSGPRISSTSVYSTASAASAAAAAAAAHRSRSSGPASAPAGPGHRRRRPGPVSSRARSSGGEVELLDRRGGHARARRAASQRVDRRRARRRPARRSSPAEQYASLADRALCCSTPSRSSRPAEQHHPLVPGQRRRCRRGRRGARAGRPRPAALITRRAGAAPAGVAVRARARPPSAVGVAGERPGPGHGRVVPGVGEVAVERPHAADEPLRCAR